ncbi:hypothetical protein FOZ60_014312 [Perkinsus olseni]|uniref:Uncharacterized protein n=1 Tax=Perkinsus olseni TaxID=32597 RepID=A0A7J6P7Y6_PEROL|nr:hypothetical protein FOZ60_014312 [Perkinsus olseni]
MSSWGPDHISAIMTVSVCQRWKAFWYGIRWGVGHSVGLAIVAVLLWTIEAETTDSRTHHFAYIASYVSGAFMLAFGLYFLLKAKSELEKIAEIMTSWSTTSRSETRKRVSMMAWAIKAQVVGASAASTQPASPVVDPVAPPSPAGDVREPEPDSRMKFCVCGTAGRTRARLVQALVSFCAGILGGIAGPGGMLAIVPATYYDTAGEAYGYIGTFFVASTMMMGIVAAVYGEGELLNRSGYFASCGASIAVGIAWIVLNATGALQKLFG